MLVTLQDGSHFGSNERPANNAMNLSAAARPQVMAGG